MLAVIASLWEFRHWLSGTLSPVSIITDHNNLCYFMSQWNCPNSISVSPTHWEIQINGLAGESLHENLHSTTKTKDEMERRLLHNGFIVLDLGPNAIDNVRGLNLKSDGLAAGEGLGEDLHSTVEKRNKRKC